MLLFLERCSELVFAHLLYQRDFSLAEFNVQIVILGVQGSFITLLHAIINIGTRETVFARRNSIKCRWCLLYNGLLGFVILVKLIILVVILILLFLGRVLIDTLLLGFALGSSRPNFSGFRQVSRDLQVVFELVTESAVDVLFGGLSAVALLEFLIEEP